MSNRPMLRFLSGMLLLLASVPASAKDTSVAHFYFYRPAPGKSDAFEQGYRRHLDWHRRHRDPLAWYAWTVEDGARAGQFVDASMGEPFAAFDRRIDPAGDGADAVASFVPFATALARPTYVLLEDLSTGVPLERRQPAATMQVTVFHVRPGTEGRFERALLAMRRALRSLPEAPSHTWYRLVVGGEAPQYLLLVPRENWASYGRFDLDMDRLLAGDSAVQEDLAASVRTADVETWRYRPELSLLPAPAR